jgi:hypothetical protein
VQEERKCEGERKVDRKRLRDDDREEERGRE